MIREEDKDAAVCRIIEKLQNSSLFLEMKADVQVNIKLTVHAGLSLYLHPCIFLLNFILRNYFYYCLLRRLFKLK